MVDNGKKNILGVLIDAVDYEAAVDRIFEAAGEGRGLAVSALAVHGLMTGVLDSVHKYRLNRFDLLVPDGQPVRWALNWIHRTGLRDRVYGPNLMLAVCERAAREGLTVFLYGSTEETLYVLKHNLERRFPGLRIAGVEPSKFRRLTTQEKREVVERIRNSGASIVLVGLGCPRQEVWAYEFREAIARPLLAVGAAFPFHAGKARQAPVWIQDRGLEWLFRLVQEPKRLWRRYLLLNPAYLFFLALQGLGLGRWDTRGRAPAAEILYG